MLPFFYQSMEGNVSTRISVVILESVRLTLHLQHTQLTYKPKNPANFGISFWAVVEVPRFFNISGINIS